MKRILVVDDEKNMCLVLQMLLQNDGYAVSTAADGGQAIELLERGEVVDLVVSDLRMPNSDGMGLLRYLRDKGRRIPLVMITAFGTIENAVEAMKGGAVDFITKPFDKDVLRHVVRRSLQMESLEAENRLLRDVSGTGEFVCASAAMANVVGMLRKASTTLTPLLLTGESGTGKGAAAKLVHSFRETTDGRSDLRPFVHINCPTIPETLFESELFGYQKGAFTGASSDFRGKVRLADGGTLFLDEIAEVPLHLQSKLLQLLEERTYEPLGSTTTIHIEAKVICATNRDLGRLVRERLFREDLFFRINTIAVHLPPLRERPEDIILLARFFLTRLAAEIGGKSWSLAKESENALVRYSWPGNARELHNVLERALVLSDSGRIEPDDLPPQMVDRRARTSVLDADAGNRIDESERRLLVETLERCGWNISASAKALGVSRSRLRYRMQKYGLGGG
jgi:two-component system response regulator AtoC